MLKLNVPVTIWGFVGHGTEPACAPQAPEKLQSLSPTTSHDSIWQLAPPSRAEYCADSKSWKAVANGNDGIHLRPPPFFVEFSTRTMPTGSMLLAKTNFPS